MKRIIIQLLKRIYSLFHIVPNNKDIDLSTNDKQITEEPKEINVANRFKNISFGDIVQAKRIDKNNPTLVIEPGHTIGPFLVLENKGDTLLCLFGSSNCNKFNASNRFIIDNRYYDKLTKQTCFYINRFSEITLDIYIKKLGTLNECDSHILQRKLNVLGRKK